MLFIVAESWGTKFVSLQSLTLRFNIEYRFNTIYSEYLGRKSTLLLFLDQGHVWNLIWLQQYPLASVVHPGKYSCIDVFLLYFQTFQNNIPKDRNQKPKIGFFYQDLSIILLFIQFPSAQPPLLRGSKKASLSCTLAASCNKEEAKSCSPYYLFIDKQVCSF